MPIHEVVQTTKLFDDFQARTQPQMVGVAQNDLGIDVVQVFGCHRFDTAISAYWLEDRGFNSAMI